LLRRHHHTPSTCRQFVGFAVNQVGVSGGRKLGFLDVHVYLGLMSILWVCDIRLREQAGVSITRERHDTPTLVVRRR